MAPSPNDIHHFQQILLNPRLRIMAVCGAGLSASSGLPTFRGAGGLWRNHEATSLATPEAFMDNPGLVWLFYGYRRHMSLKAKPNPAHFALAALAKKMGNRFLCVSQNVDDLLQRAGHPPEQLNTIHGHLFDLKCADPTCTWRQKGNKSDPLWPILAPASQDVNPNETLPLLDPKTPAPDIKASDIPKCPQCQAGLQRPDIVWFGESWSEEMTDSIERWTRDGRVDAVVSIGTSEAVSTATYFIHEAMGRGAAYVNVNLDAEEPRKVRSMRRGKDFAFGGDAAELLPVLFEPIVGKMKEDGTFEEDPQ